MAVYWQDVVARSAALAAIPAPAQDRILASATRQCSASAWGADREEGIILLAAHMATISLQGTRGAAGPVTQETVGQMSRSYGSAYAASAGTYGATAFGLEYRRLLRTLPCTIGTVP